MRRVTDNVYIGSSRAPVEHGHKFDRVVSLADANESTTHEYTIDDGDHDYETFVEAVESVRDGIQNGERVLVHCRAGISRSTTVTAAALGSEEGIPPSRAYEKCRAYQHAATQLRDSMKRYLRTH